MIHLDRFGNKVFLEMDRFPILLGFYAAVCYHRWNINVLVYRYTHICRNCRFPCSINRGNAGNTTIFT